MKTRELKLPPVRLAVLITITLLAVIASGCGRTPAFKEELTGYGAPGIASTGDSSTDPTKQGNAGREGGINLPGDGTGTSGTDGSCVAPCDPNDPNNPNTHPGDEGDPVINPDDLEPFVQQADQGALKPLDILWVVDGSPSMEEEQTFLGQNFQAFITQLARIGANFQIAVTSVDVCQDTMPSDLSQRVCPAEYGGSPATHLRGNFRGDVGRKVLKQSDGDLISRFTSYTHLGTGDSGFEHGLKAAQMAVDKVRSGQNEALLRNGAFLSVIVVSDEEDDGIGLGMKDAYNNHNFVAEGLTTFRFSDDDLISYLNGVKGAGNFSVSAIAATRNADGTMCSAPHSMPLEEGTQYIKVAHKTGGILQSICDTNWNNLLAQMGADMSSQISQIKLNATPALVSSIHVSVNGAPTANFIYVKGSNTIKFNADSVPPPGSHITISFMILKH